MAILLILLDTIFLLSFNLSYLYISLNFGCLCELGLTLWVAPPLFNNKMFQLWILDGVSPRIWTWLIIIFLGLPSFLSSPSPLPNFILLALPICTMDVLVNLGDQIPLPTHTPQKKKKTKFAMLLGVNVDADPFHTLFISRLGF